MIRGPKLKRRLNTVPIFCPSIQKMQLKESLFLQHGMMHSFYPRQTSTRVCGIDKSGSSLLLEQSFEDGVIYVSLNVSVLSADFKSFIQASNSLFL
jgi:hypothetical protein